MKLSQKGQATVETSLMGLMIAIFFAGFLMVCYLICSFYWIKHNLYESLICFEAVQKKVFCEDRALKKIKSLLPLDNKDSVRIELGLKSITAKFFMNIHASILEIPAQPLVLQESLGI